MMEHLRKLAPTAQAGAARALPSVRSRVAAPGPLKDATAAAAVAARTGVSGDRPDASDAAVASRVVDRRQAADGWPHQEARGRFIGGAGAPASSPEHGGQSVRDGPGWANAGEARVGREATGTAAVSRGAVRQARESGSARAGADAANGRGMRDDGQTGGDRGPAFMPRGGVSVHGTDGSGMGDIAPTTDTISAQALRAQSFVAPVSIEALAARRAAASGPTIVHVEIDRIDLRLPAAATPPTPSGKAAPRAGATELAEWLRRGRAPHGGRP